MLHWIREVWGRLNENFDGSIDADETCIGGHRASMSKAKRKELADTGQGTLGKTTVAGVKDHMANKVRTIIDMVGKRLMYRRLVADNGLPSGARA